MAAAARAGNGSGSGDISITSRMLSAVTGSILTSLLGKLYNRQPASRCKLILVTPKLTKALQQSRP